MEKIIINPTGKDVELDFCIDIETLSQKKDAAILSIAVHAFSRNGSVKLPNDMIDTEVFIQPMDCIMHGLDVEADTCKWWSKKAEDRELYDTMILGMMKSERLADGLVSIICHINNIIKYFNEAFNAIEQKEELHASIRYWSQGKDFDFPILENAIMACNNADKNISCNGVTLNAPWKFYDLRCARDYVLNGIETLYGHVEKPYDKIKKFEGKGSVHTSLFDAQRSAWNVQMVYQMLRDNLKN